MPSTRSGVTVATTQANTVDFCNLVRIDMPSPVGTQRFADRAADVAADVADGAGSQTWPTTDFTLLNIDQSSTDILAPSGISFANIGYTWTNWVMTLAAASKSLRGARCSVYRCWFTSVGAVDFIEKLYIGTVDNQSLGVQAQIALSPFGTPWARDTPWMTLPMIDPVFGKLMPNSTQTIYWGDTSTPAQSGLPTGSGGAKPPPSTPRRHAVRH